ncbi:MAG: IS481 family transposase [Gaiellales bacterium]
MSHRNAPLTVEGRRRMVERRLAGYRVSDVAAMFGVSRETVYEWTRRYQAEGLAGLVDRSSRPHVSPRRTPEDVERRVVRLRKARLWGADRISLHTGVPRSTVQRILIRHGCGRLRDLCRVTRRVVRRYERDAPGSLIHLDTKVLGRIPPGGGWRIHGRGQAGKRRRVGVEYLHVAIDDHSRVVYEEILDDQTGQTCAAFLGRVIAYFSSLGVTVEEVMTDNAMQYVDSHAFKLVLSEHRINHLRIRPRRPQTNGKVERYNGVISSEFIYKKRFRSNQQRRRELDAWTHEYNYHRAHTAIGSVPAARVNNVCREDT